MEILCKSFIIAFVPFLEPMFQLLVSINGAKIVFRLLKYPLFFSRGNRCAHPFPLTCLVRWHFFSLRNKGSNPPLPHVTNRNKPTNPLPPYPCYVIYERPLIKTNCRFPLQNCLQKSCLLFRNLCSKGSQRPSVKKDPSEPRKHTSYLKHSSKTARGCLVIVTQSPIYAAWLTSKPLRWVALHCAGTVQVPNGKFRDKVAYNSARDCMSPTR